jgi:hypothetical protein
VDGNSPEPIKRSLEIRAREHNFTLLRSDHYLTPNQARNLAVSRANGKYLAFVDNDVRVYAGWLEHLVACAENEGAWVVAPLYLEGSPEEEIVHTAGGIARFQSFNGRRQFFEQHLHHGERLDQIAGTLRRSRTEMVEFHCVLVASDYFKVLGPLDEKLMSMAEHIDLTLAAKEFGKPVFVEPSAIIRYPKPSIEPSDIPYFLLRWSDEWTEVTVDRLIEKWHLSPDDPFLADQFAFARQHRRKVLASCRLKENCQLDNSQRVDPKLDSSDSCAHTIVQLANQVALNGYTDSDLDLISKGYEIAMNLFHRKVRSSGKTFVSHLIGTASILAGLKVEVSVIVAAILHAAYFAGDFESNATISGKRAFLRNALGRKIEGLIFDYSQLPWNSTTILDLHSRLDWLMKTEREVLLIRLANELEEALDFSISYCDDQKYQNYRDLINEYMGHMVEMAERLGYPSLANKLLRIPKEALAAPRRRPTESEAPPPQLDHASTVPDYRSV